MIKGQDLFKELKKLTSVQEKLVKDGKEFEASLLQASILQVKLLLNIRQNQVVDLNHRGVDLIKPKTRDGETHEES